jgi:hypothetical protein
MEEINQNVLSKINQRSANIQDIENTVGEMLCQHQTL